MVPTTTSASPPRSVSPQPMTEELVAVAIANVVSAAKAKGASREELELQLLADDNVLDRQTRIWLTQVVTSVWESIEEAPLEKTPGTEVS